MSTIIEVKNVSKTFGKNEKETEKISERRSA